MRLGIFEDSDVSYVWLDLVSVTTSWAASAATSVATASWSSSVASTTTSITTSSSAITSASASAITSASASSIAIASQASLHSLVVLDKVLGVLDEWRWDSTSGWPKVWRQHSVGLSQAGVGSSAEVFSGTGLTDTTGVNVIDTSELKDLLGDVGGNATGTSWGWDHSNGTRTTLSLYLGWDGMDVTDSGTPITSSNWDKLELSIDEGTLDGNLDFLANLDTDTNMAVSITDSADSLESSSLTGLGLLLNGEDAHDVIGENFLKRLALVLVLEKLINDLGFLDWDGSSVNFFEDLNLSHLDKSTQLGKRHPFVALAFATVTAAWTATSATSATSAASIASSAASSEASAASISASAFSAGWSVTCWCWCCCIHFLVKMCFE